MKRLLPYSLILLSLFLFGCPDKEETVTPDLPTNPSVSKDTVRVLQVDWWDQVFFFGPRSNDNATDKVEYLELDYFPSDKKHIFRLPITVDKFCDDPEFDCGNRNNIKVEFENLDIETLSLPGDKYLVMGSAARILLKEGSKLIISTIDKKPIFTAKTATKNYSVNRVEFIAKTIDLDKYTLGHLEPAQSTYNSHVRPGITAFTKYWGDASIAQPENYGTFNVDFSKRYGLNYFSSRRTKTELTALLKKAISQNFSIVRKWTGDPIVSNGVSYENLLSFSVITILEKEQSESFKIIK